MKGLCQGLSLVIACAVVAETALAQSGTGAVAPRPASIGKPVETIRVLLVPENEAVISSQIAGRITALPAALGSRIRKGDVLVRFDCSEQAARLKMSEAELLSARETHASKQQLQSYRSASELDVRLASANLEKAHAQVNVVNAQLSYCNIAAPFAGRLVKLRARPHEIVTAGQPLLDLVDNSAFRFQLHVPSRWLSWLREGTQFSIRVDETGKTYPARVKVINGRVDPASQTVELTGAVEGKHKELIAGMSGAAEFNER